MDSICLAKKEGSSIRMGSELEISGFGCEDHYLEEDTIKHCWEVVAEILNTDLTDNILCGLGMPVMHNNILYNCYVLCYNRQIYLIRPKVYICDEGIYRERRWFTPWTDVRRTETFIFPSIIQQITSQTSCTIGNALLCTFDTKIGLETCQEMWVPLQTCLELALAGGEIFLNGSASHHEINKMQRRAEIITESMKTNGGVYVYSNQIGCDGRTMFYDGAACICVNGDFVAQGKQFDVSEVQVVTAVVDLAQVKARRMLNKGRADQATLISHFPEVNVPMYVSRFTYPNKIPSQPSGLKLYSCEEQIGFGAALWLWDYLRRSGAQGFFLPLSGGSDSAAVATIVAIMCFKVFETISQGKDNVLDDLRKIAKDKEFTPKTKEEIVNRLFHTCYMGTKNSSSETKDRAKQVAMEIGCSHYESTIDEMVKGIEETFESITAFHPKFTKMGGSYQEDLALQNIQARSRMILSYMLSSLIPSIKKGSGFLLVLGSANNDEALRGYYTKYDCSSADVNPIGDLNKQHIRNFLVWAAQEFNYPVLIKVKEATPTAELRPLPGEESKEKAEETKIQTDEDEMGMTYAELSQYGIMRKYLKMGPMGMFEHLLPQWTELTVTEVAEKVKKFFIEYSKNRHKMFTMTPACHLTNYGCEDKRFDLRPLLYNSQWTHQFANIDQIAQITDHQLQLIKKSKQNH